MPGSTASLAAELGVAVFKLGFERWATSRRPRDFAGHIRAAMVDLKTLTGTDAPKRVRRSNDA